MQYELFLLLLLTINICVPISIPSNNRYENDLLGNENGII